MPAPVPPPLSAAHATFIQGAVSIIAGSADAAGLPSLMRAVGCRVAPDRRRVTLLLRGSQSRVLLADLRRSGRLAVVFSKPSQHRTLQLKAEDAVVDTAGAAELALLADYTAAMVEEIARVGFDEAFVRAMLGCPPQDLVTVTFTPSAAYEQTPGPGAGAPLPLGEPA